MNEFDTFINQALNKGLSDEDIAKQFSEALNKATAANKSKKEKETYLLNLRASVEQATKQGNFTFNIAAIVAGLAAVKQYPDWTGDQLLMYIRATEAALVETGKVSGAIYNDEHPLAAVVKRMFDKDGEGSDEVKLKRFLRGLG